MTAAQTKGHEEDKNTGMQGKRRKERKEKRKTKSRKQGTKASKQENRTQDVSMAKNLPVSATKPRRGPCHTICHFLPALIGNGIKCHCCRCRAPPPRTNQRKPNKTARTRGLYVATQVPFNGRPVPCHTMYLFVSAFVDSSISTAAPPSLSSLLASSVAWRSQLLSASSLCHLVMTFRRFDDSLTHIHRV